MSRRMEGTDIIRTVVPEFVFVVGFEVDFPVALTGSNRSVRLRNTNPDQQFRNPFAAVL